MACAFAVVCACSIYVPRDVVGPNIDSATFVTLHLTDSIVIKFTFESRDASSTVESSIVAVLALPFNSQNATGSGFPGSLR